MKISIGITGSQGFIGHHLASSLKKSGKYDLVLFDHKHHDLMEQESLKTFVSERNIIFHIAGANRDTNANIVRINTLGTLNLLEAIKKYGKKKVRFIYISSIQVYNPSSGNSALKEKNQYSLPNTIFGISKITAEKLIDLYDMDSIIFRLSNVYGPYCKPFYNSVVATFCYLIVNNKSIRINGDGEQKRDFIFISDVIDALMKAVDYKGDNKEVFNLGSGKLTSLNQIIKTIKTISGKNIQVEHITNTQDAIVSILTDQQEICSKLKWKQNVNLENGLRETFQYFQTEGKKK